MKNAVRLAALCAVCFILAGCLSSGLPTIAEVPDFTLTGEDGQQFKSSEELAHKVWVADFIFTTCHGPCPRMSAHMKRIQDATQDLADVELVSITTDPRNDTPEKLKEYAQRFKYDPERWHFLTGPAAELNRIGNDTFHLGGA